MPELPEVETVVNGLKKQLLGESFEQFEIFQNKMRVPLLPEQIEPVLHQKIIAFNRMGKYFSINFSNQYVLLFHLGMSGKLFLCQEQELTEKHRIITFKLSRVLPKSKNNCLVFYDMRRFGLLIGMPTEQIFLHPLIKNLAPDPFAKEFSPQYLWQKIEKTQKRKNQKNQRSIKEFLMDQKIISGLGNIYACELLFRLGLHPQTPVQNISVEQCKAIVQETKKLLRFAIQKQGSSVSDYVDSAGKKGGFQFFFAVYKKENEPCKKCSTQIVRIKQAGRSTFFCPHCQKHV